MLQDKQSIEIRPTYLDYKGSLVFNVSGREACTNVKSAVEIHGVFRPHFMLFQEGEGQLSDGF